MQTGLSLVNSALEKITWIFNPGHASITGNERADSLASSAAIDNDLVHDLPTILQCVKEKTFFKTDRPPSSLYTVARLKEKKFIMVKTPLAHSDVQLADATTNS